MEIKRGKCFVITDISGGGKTTVAEIISRNYQELYQGLRMTIREPREGEIHGVHYEFVTSEEMVRLDMQKALYITKNGMEVFML